MAGFNVDEAHIYGTDFALRVVTEVDGIVAVPPAGGSVLQANLSWMDPYLLSHSAVDMVVSSC